MVVFVVVAAASAAVVVIVDVVVVVVAVVAHTHDDDDNVDVVVAVILPFSFLEYHAMLQYARQGEKSNIPTRREERKNSNTKSEL